MRELQKILAQNIYVAEHRDKYSFLNVILDIILKYTDLIKSNNAAENTFMTTHFENAFAVIEAFARLKIKRFLRIKSSEFVRFLNLVENFSYFDANKILKVAVHLSHSNSYGKIEFDLSKENFDEQINLVLNKHMQNNYDLVITIKKNLNERSIGDRLEYFKNLYDQNENIADLVLNYGAFFDDLHFIAVLLNKDNDVIEYFYLDLFERCDSFKIFAKVLEHLFLRLIDQFDDTVDYLKDILDIISRFVQGSMSCTEYFLKYSLFTMVIQFLADKNVFLELLQAKIKFICKIIAIFSCMCKTINLTPNQTWFSLDDLNMLKVLCVAKNYLKESTIDDSDTNSTPKEMPIFRAYLSSLAYLQAKIQTATFDLMDSNDYAYLANGGYTRSVYTKVSKDFLNSCDIIRSEFINEFNKKEMQNVTRSLVPGDMATGLNVFSTFTQIGILNKLRFIYSLSEEKRVLGFKNYNCFILSMVYYGLDIEIIIALKCLIEYCSVEQIKQEVFNNKNLFNHLKSLVKENASNNSNGERLKSMINDFFNIFKKF